MCLFNDAELNWVKTKMRLILELMQLLIGISTRRYLPAMGTAGFERAAVNGYSLVPAPPPRITAITDCDSVAIEFRFYILIYEVFSVRCQV
jgi:hypothetical protein